MVVGSSPVAVSNKHGFYKCHDIIKFKSNSIATKYDDLDNFQRDLDNFNIVEPPKEYTEENKIIKK